MKRSKRVQNNLELVTQRLDGRRKSAGLKQAVGVLQQTKGPKFDETVELAVRLGIDTKKSDQMVRGAISLPRGIGREMRVIAFAKGDKADQAREAGALEVGDEELANRIKGGWMDFDVVVASPDMMKIVGQLGRVLGPQGKMPSPKSGTVTPKVADAVREFKAGKVTVRADSGGNVHSPVGKRSFPLEHLVENIESLMAYIRSMKPPTSKGAYILSAAVTTSMGPSVIVEGI